MDFEERVEKLNQYMEQTAREARAAEERHNKLDERLEKLAERHKALAETVELMAMENRAGFERLARLSELVEQFVQSMNKF
jgi:outer membrane murein-binding lipoprotein Lpp